MLIEFNKIKKLIQSIALFLTLSYTNLYADAGHNYLCETEMFVAFPNGENPIRYDNEILSGKCLGLIWDGCECENCL